MRGSLAAITVVVIGGFVALRSTTISQAERGTRERAELGTPRTSNAAPEGGDG